MDPAESPTVLPSEEKKAETLVENGSSSNGNEATEKPSLPTITIPAPAAPAPKQHRKHRRTSSEDLGRTYQQMHPGYYNQGYPPSQISYNGHNPSAGSLMNGVPLQHPSYSSPEKQMQQQQQMQHTPPPGGSGHHQRVRSWSMEQGSPYQYPPSPGYPMQYPQAFSAAGNPLVPMFNDPNMPPMGAPHQQPQYNGSGSSSSSSRRKRREHRRTHSTPSYGSVNMFDPSGTPPPGPPSGPPPPLPSGRNKRDFSPRSEIMKLTVGSMGSSQRQHRQHHGSVSPKRSPQRSPTAPMVPVHAQSPFLTASESGMRVSFSPASTPRRVYGMNGEDDAAAAALFGGSPAMPYMPTDSDRFGGEAVFSAQSKKHSHRKSPSNRMHMRQKSAQLFMEDIKGQEQTPSCRDIFWLMFFVFHIIGIVYLGNLYGPEAVQFHDEVPEDSSVTIIYNNVIYVACLSGCFAVTISALTLLLMSALAKQMVQIALIIAIALSFAWGTIGIGLSPKMVVPATGVIALALSVAYAFIVWDRIPFASANLDAALHGIKANPGSIVIAFFFQFLALGWSIYFTYVAVGVYDAMEDGTIDIGSAPDFKILMYCALAVSYYWTLHVFLNIVQVTVAGVIGSWWFTADGDTSTRKEDLSRAFFRSTFYAIGSICYGSLVVGPVRLIRQISVFFRPNEEVSSLMCLHECFHCIQKCITSCVDSLADRYSPWGFTYVGLYGYSLVDAGLHSTELFEKRGWTTIVSDDLVPNVLLMTSLVIGGVTGLFAHLIENFEALTLTSLGEPVSTSFLVGLLVGLVVSSVLFGIISSSVNAVIVCFASSPVDFESNHPSLSNEMRAAWREVWPGCMDVVDMRVAVAAYLDPSMGGGGETQPLLA